MALASAVACFILSSAPSSPCPRQLMPSANQVMSGDGWAPACRMWCMCVRACACVRMLRVGMHRPGGAWVAWAMR